MHQPGLKSWAGDLCRFLEEIDSLPSASLPLPALSFPSLPITLSLILCYVNSSFLVFLLELTLSSKLNHLVLPGNFLCAIVRGFSQYLSLVGLFFQGSLSHVPRLQNASALSFGIPFLKSVCLFVSGRTGNRIPLVLSWPQVKI